MNRNSTSILTLNPVSRARRFCVNALGVTTISVVALSGAIAQAQDKDNSKVPAPLREVLENFNAGKAVSATATLPVNIGYFGGQASIYIAPEVGVDPAANGGAYVGLAHFLANAFRANYIVQNFATLTTPPNNSAIADPIYVFPAGTPTTFNGTFIQPNILNSSPHPTGPGNTDANYTPLWQINLVYFQPGKQRLLKSAQDVAAAQAEGDFLPGFPAAIPIVVECTVVYTPAGGVMPGTSIQPVRVKSENKDSDDNKER